MRSKVVLLSSFLVLAGCESETVKKVHVMDPLAGASDVPHEPREKALKDKVEADPKDAKAWFELGEYYEGGMQYIQAAEAYEHGNSLMEPGRYTGGHYLLARVYLRLQEWDQTLAHLNEIFKLEPKDPKSACLNPHFREAHYLRGAVFYLNKQWHPAKREFLRFIEIGGDENRVEEWLDDIQAQGE